jgi:hypothetical protein
MHSYVYRDGSVSVFDKRKNMSISLLSSLTDNRIKAALALSTAFWDAQLLQDEKAKSCLNGDAPPMIMEKKDRWQTK